MDIRQLISRLSTRTKRSAMALAVAALAGGWGAYGIGRSSAATFTATTEAESGQISGNAGQGSPVGASGGASTKFGTAASPLPAPTPTPTPSTPAKPDATNTGVPAGTTLVVMNGNQSYATAGQTISGVDVHGKVIINGNNVTLRNAIVRGPSTGSCSNGAAIEINGNGVVVENVEVVMSNPTACLDGVWMDSATLRQVHIHSGVDGVKAGGGSVIENSYIHDLNYFTSDPNQGGGPTHNDAVQILSGTNITMSHNNFDLASVANANSDVQITQDFGVVNNVHIAGNWLDGGGCSLNIAHKVQPSLTGIYITDNRFGRHRGFNGCTILLSTKTTLSAYSGNVYDDTGTAVPTPQVHD